jgi:hypothetical protein
MINPWLFVPALLMTAGIILFDAAVKTAGALPNLTPVPFKA